jgi:hypothetical protein
MMPSARCVSFARKYTGLNKISGTLATCICLTRIVNY